jgi:RNA polymerase sigma-70 factor, ECF subfamily
MQRAVQGARRRDIAGVFENQRSRLFGIAYRMLGTVADAEDLVQEAWLRWQRSDRSVVRNPEAWLVTIVSRLSIDRLRQAAAERETYTGTWLPEPVDTDTLPPPDRNAEIASDLSIAFLVLLERLSPDERIAFILREVFDSDYAEIADVLGRSEAACRQVVHRARERIRSDRARHAVPAEAKEQLLERFLAAVHNEDRDGVLSLLTDATTFASDGGGKVAAARNVLRGADRISRLFLGLQRKGSSRLWGRVVHTIESINGEPAIVTRADGHLVATTSVDTDGERILAFYRVMNPDKLRHIDRAGISSPDK